MKQRIKLPILAFVAIFVGSCGNDGNNADVAVKPLYKDVSAFKAMSVAEQNELIANDSLPLNALTHYIGLGDADISTLSRLTNSQAIEVFTPAVDSVFPTLTPLSKALESILNKLNADSIYLPTRSYNAVVWGDSKSVVLTDSCVLIALNHFLGASYPGYTGWPEYVRATKEPEMAPYALCEALVATAFPYLAEDNSTILSRMAYDGALAMARLQTVPNATPAKVLGYNDEQYRWLEANAHRLWNEFVAQNLLYSTSETAADRLLSPAPATAILSPDCPGRAGRFFGFLIVKHSMKQLNLSLKDVLRPDFYNNPSLLIDSRFSI